MTAQQKNLKIVSLLCGAFALLGLVFTVVQATKSTVWTTALTAISVILCAAAALCTLVLSARGIKGANVPRLAKNVVPVALAAGLCALLAAGLALWLLRWLYAIPELLELAAAGLAGNYAKKVDKLT